MESIQEGAGVSPGDTDAMSVVRDMVLRVEFIFGG
jgi:hypothetical protein